MFQLVFDQDPHRQDDGGKDEQSQDRHRAPAPFGAFRDGQQQGAQPEGQQQGAQVIKGAGFGLRIGTGRDDFPDHDDGCQHKGCAKPEGKTVVEKPGNDSGQRVANADSRGDRDRER
ncbi:hypothetical protein D3C74_343800 [compost metagenome]